MSTKKALMILAERAPEVEQAAVEAAITTLAAAVKNIPDTYLREAFAMAVITELRGVK